MPAEGARLGGAALRVAPNAMTAARAEGLDEVTVGLRPESARLVSAGSPDALDLTVRLVEELGADAYVYGTTEIGGERRPIIARVDGRTPPDKGAVLHFAPSGRRFARSGEDHAFADAEQAIRAPDGATLLAVHVVSLLRRAGVQWRIADSRPYAFTPAPG